jgi:hypothetical protein
MSELSATASDLRRIPIRPLSCHQEEEQTDDVVADEDSSLSFGWGDFPLITASHESSSSSMAAALCSSTLDDGVTLADDVLSNKSIGKSSSSSVDILVHPLNDDADGDMILFRPLSASLKVTTVPCCNTNEVDGVSETESRTSACSCSDDDLSEEFDVQVTLKKQQDKQDVAKQECCHQRRHVQFATVSVREHAVTIGNHPYCTGAYPLTLDWPHTPPSSSSSSYHGGGSEYEYSIDDYEDQQEQKRARRRHRSLLRVQTSFQRRESSSSYLATVHSLVGSQHQQHQQQQQQQAVR